MVSEVGEGDWFSYIKAHLRNIFSMVKHWGRLPREVTESQSLKVFKNRQMANASLGWFTMGLSCLEPRVGLDNLLRALPALCFVILFQCSIFTGVGYFHPYVYGYYDVANV